MASAVEQLAANMSFSSFSKAKDLKGRIWFTLGVLLLYRVGTYIPLPGVNPTAVADLFAQNQANILGVVNLFAGGALGRMAIFALNIFPYITASIIMQLLSAVWAPLEKIKKDGELGRKQINQYTRYLTVVLCAAQAYGLAIVLENGQGLVENPGWFFRFTAVVTLVGGTMLLMWLGERITSRGIGNGISLIIYAGIVAELPSVFVQTLDLGRQGAVSTPLIFGMIALAIIVVGVIVLVERAQRRVVIQYPKQQVGRRMMGGDTSHLPIKVNISGVIPAIFASSLLLLPTTYAQFSGADAPGWVGWVVAQLGRGQPIFLLIYGAMIAFFAFFYTTIVFNTQETSDNLRRQGGFVPGIRPGKKTAEYLDYIVQRITTFGAIYLVGVCLMPEVISASTSIPFYFGGTSLLIVVSVTLDTVSQIQSHLISHQYESLIKSAQAGRKGRGRKAR